MGETVMTKENKYHGQSDCMNRFSRILDSIPDFISVHDKNFTVIEANRALVEFLAKQRDDIVGKACYEIFHAAKTKWPGCPHAKAIRTGKPVKIMIEEPSLGIPLEITCSPYFDEKGVLAGTVHIARDVSELKDVERDKDKLIEELRLALKDVKQLSGLLPICCKCKKIRKDDGTWEQLETYFRDRTSAEFSHGYCPECYEKARNSLNGN